MKKLVISALIAGISATAPLYAQTAAADSIEQQVFDKSFDVAVLSPQEIQKERFHLQTMQLWWAQV